MNFKATDTGLSFKVEGSEDAQITVELEEGASYNVSIDGAFEGSMATNMGGKIVLSVSLEEGKTVGIEVVKADRKSTRLNSSHRCTSRMPSSA